MASVPAAARNSRHPFLSGDGVEITLADGTQAKVDIDADSKVDSEVFRKVRREVDSVAKRSADSVVARQADSKVIRETKPRPVQKVGGDVARENDSRIERKPRREAEVDPVISKKISGNGHRDDVREPDSEADFDLLEDLDSDADSEYFSNEHLIEVTNNETPKPVFYKLNSANASIREFMWDSPYNPLAIPAAAIIKLFRIQLPSSTDDPPVKLLAPFAIPLDEMPDDVLDEFRPLISELKKLGFANPICHAIHDGHHRATIHWVTMRHESGRAFVRCQRRIWKAPNREKKKLFLTFVTPFTDGTYLASTSGKPDMLWPSVVDLHRDRKASIAELWEEHCRLLDEEAVSKKPRRIRDRGELTERLNEYHDVFTEFHVDPGVFAEMSTAEQARALSAAPAGSALGGEADQEFAYSDVYDEVQRQLNKQQTWLSFTLLLGVSLIAFALLGTFAWSGKTVLLLIPVLLFHEAGHYVAMKLCGYRNLKMFFIPLLGAAVSAESLSVPSWKKVFVSLAGPVPGIALGIALGIIGMVQQIEWLHEISMMLIILNGINLVPILPFDGGWVVHALLFSRHYGLDVTFRVLTGLAMLFVAALSKGGFMLGLGIFMLIGAQTTYKLGKVAEAVKPKLKKALRRENDLSRKTVSIIAQKIDDSFKQQAMNLKVRAQLTKNVFEMIKCPPPGWLASFFFAGVYLGSILSAIVFAAVLFIAKNANFADLLAVADAAPTTPYVSGTSQFVAGANASPTVPEVTIIAECTDAQTANTLFNEFKGQIPATGTFRVFGQTLLLALPAADGETKTQWAGTLETRCQSVVVHSEVLRVPLTIACAAPNIASAEAISQSFNNYAMDHRFKSLISPWSTDPPLSPEHQRARMTLRLLRDEYGKSEDSKLDDELTGITKRSIEARERGDKDALDKINAERAALFKAQRVRHIESVKSRNDVDQELIAIYAREPQMPEVDWSGDFDEEDIEASAPARAEYKKAHAVWCDEVAVRLGQLPGAGDMADAKIDPYGTRSGYCTQAGPLLRFDYIQLQRPVDGVPALAEWLYSQKCIDIKYRLTNEIPGLDLEDLE